MTQAVDGAAFAGRGLGWGGIVRLGLVQMGLGAVAVLTTDLLNRVMAVEVGLLQSIPAALIAWHYVVQLSRPRWGHGSDAGRRRTPWILGGMALLALSCVGAAASAPLMAENFYAGLALAAVCYTGFGVGIGAAGTSLLALLAAEVAPERRGVAASLVFIMMIAGFVASTIGASIFLEPFSYGRLVAVCAAIGGLATLVAAIALAGVEAGLPRRAHAAREASTSIPFREALADVWGDPTARRFTYFVFVAMFAFQAQDPILEPFAARVFGYSVAESTALAGVHRTGVLVGMLVVALVTYLARGRRVGALGLWTAGGCAASGASLIVLAGAGLSGTEALVKPSVAALGFSNGAFAVAAIASMMALAGAGRRSKEGVRMGVWGAAQALGFGAAGLVAAGAADLAFARLGAHDEAYALVFYGEAGLFVVAALVALRVRTPSGARVGVLVTDVDAAPASRPA